MGAAKKQENKKGVREKKKGFKHSSIGRSRGSKKQKKKEVKKEDKKQK